MAEYDYKCTKCGRVKTYELGMNEPRPERCTHVSDLGDPFNLGKEWTTSRYCNGKLIRLFTMPNVVYRAGGFQTTDDRLTPDPDDIGEIEY